MSISVLLADDHAVVRDGVRRVLEDAGGIMVVGEAADGLAALEATERLHPHVLLLDIGMPQLSGLEVAREIAERHPAVAVVFLTQHDSEQYFLEALRTGAKGYLPKSAPSSEVVEAIRQAASGHVYLDPSVNEFLLESFLRTGQRDAADDPYDALTTREREVLSLIANGLTTQQIAERLYLSPNTIHRHRMSVLQKLGLHSRMELLRFCIQRGIVES